MRMILVALLVCCVTAGVASAQPATYSEGQARYAAQDYLGAAAKFEAAYAETPDPAILFNIAQAYRLGHACAQAARFYHRFLDAVPAPPNRDKLDAYLREMDTCAAREAELAPLHVVHDTRVVHEVQVVDRGRARRRTIALAVGGAGVVGLATGLYFSHDLSYLQHARETVCPAACTWADVRDRAADLDRRGRRAEVAEAVAYGIGGAALVTSIALYVLSRDRTERAVAAVPVAGGALVTAGWSF